MLYSPSRVQLDMAKRVVIDKDILGWSDEHAKELQDEYEGVLQVGKHHDLPQRSFDHVIAAYCLKNDCDLMTGDARSYTHFFEAGIKSVRITRHDRWAKADKYVYLVQIE